MNVVQPFLESSALTQRLKARKAGLPAACAGAVRLAHELARLPQAGSDQATLNEFRLGIATVATGETEDGARRFTAGAGRHGKPVRGCGRRGVLHECNTA